MKKLTRTKILIERIEAAIEKNQRRIAGISEQNFQLRTSLEMLKARPENKPLTKADLEARDKTNRLGKFYDAAYHEEQREAARKAKEEIEKEAADYAAKLAEDARNEKIGGTI